MTFRRGFKIAVKAVAVSCALVAIFVAASQALGGPVSLVVVEGSSMEPGYHRGDLVLVRRSGSYVSGDVVAYRSDRLGALVLHRITARSGDRFIVKGDNNDWTDPERPAATDLLGRELIRVPAAGRLLVWMPTPQGVAAAVAVGLLVGGVAALRRRGRRVGGKRHTTEPRSPRVTPVRHLLGARKVVAASFGALMVLSIGLGLAGTIGSRAEQAHAYEHTGAFAYSAKVNPGPVYQKDLIETGDPIYLGVARRVSVEFRYEFRSTSPHRLSGSGRLLAEIADDTGWKHVIELQPRQPFAGDEATLRGVLDLHAVQAAIERFQRITDVRGSSYAVTLMPEVRIGGTLAGAKFEDTFDARLGLRLDSVLLRLGPTASNSDEDPLHPTAPGRLDVADGQQSEAFLVPFSAAAARRMALAAGGLSIAGLLLVTAFTASESMKSEDEAARILKRYRQWIVPIHAAPYPGSSVVDVMAMESLLRLADRHGRMVLHTVEDAFHTFLVEDEGAVYRYRPRALETETKVPGETSQNALQGSAVRS